VDIAAPKPTLHRFRQLETRLEDLLLRQSVLSEEETEQRNEELQKRLKTRLGWHLPDGMSEGAFIVGEETIASVFTEGELEARLTPSKDMATVEQEIDVTAAEIKDLCAQLSFDGEFFIEKLCRRGKSSGDWVDYSNYRNQIVAHLHLLDGEIERQPEGTQQDPTILGKTYSLPAAPPSRRARELAYAYDLLLNLWGQNGPLRSMSFRQITGDANKRRPQDDKERNPSGISETTVRRLLLGTSGK
jgi:hypothetical protein